MTDRTWHLWWIVVGKNIQARGVGSQLLAHAEEAEMPLAFETEPGMFIDTLDRFAELARGLTKERLHLRKNEHRWPPLHTPIMWERNIPNRAARLMHTLPLAAHMRFIDAARWDDEGALLLESAKKLADAGADFLICPDNNAHPAIDLIRERSPRPWLHIGEEVARVAAERGCRQLGVLGTVVEHVCECAVGPEHLRVSSDKLRDDIVHEIALRRA